MDLDPSECAAFMQNYHPDPNSSDPTNAYTAAHCLAQGGMYPASWWSLHGTEAIIIAASITVMATLAFWMIRRLRAR